ncbi:MAG: TIGR02302 family protein [Hyphomicrobiaceae bacterium]
MRASTRSIVFEQVWLRLWLLFAVIGAFFLASFAGLWPMLSQPVHIAVLAAFGLAALGATGYAAWVKKPTRETAIRRIERNSGVAHRPATSYEDTLTAQSSDPATNVIWQAHRNRLSALLAKLSVGPPAPGTHRYDPLALRALGGLSLLMYAGLLGDTAYDHIASPFRFGAPGLANDARLDAWVTPPPYTSKPPIMLADGQRPGMSLARDDGKPFEVPERSVITIRATGTGGGQLSVQFKPDSATKETASKSETFSSKPVAGVEGVAELRTELKRSGLLTVPGQAKPWAFTVIPDQPPKIALIKEPEPNQRGSMKLNYKVEDDYGIVAAEAKFARLPRAEGDEKTAWARTNVLKGPRFPHERPPRYALRLPQAGAAAATKPGEALTYLELGSHPWAGLRVRMTLEAKDAAGQIGKSEPRELELPQRRFTKPLARALVEQRRKLVEDNRYRGEVVRSLSYIMIAPEGFIDPHAYLGMRTVMARLQRDKSRAGMRSVVDQLWHIALRIEDGNLSDAERRLKDAQDKLSKAIDDGASEEEIEKLMKELRQAMNDYIEQLAKQNDGQKDQADKEDEDRQQLGQNDLEQMMRKMEQAAKNGSREQAQQMLSEMRDLMDRLQAQKGEKADREANRQMQKKMDELGNMIGQQQKLMDDTFGEMKKQGDKGRDGNQQRGQKGAGKGKPGGEKGEGQANKGEKGKGKGQSGEKGGQGEKDGEQGSGEQGESAEGGEGGQTPGEGLRQRQKKLAEQLDQLKKDLKGAGSAGSKDMDAANEAMEEAERALEQDALDEATSQQGEALEKMRQGAQKMQQEMAKNGRNKFGENGESPRDPLGRPQKSTGPDAGASVKVPGEIDMQRAREILQELRKRSAEQTRPPVELDYLERLLKRF